MAETSGKLMPYFGRSASNSRAVLPWSNLSKNRGQGSRDDEFGLQQVHHYRSNPVTAASFGAKAFAAAASVFH
ncbi:unnamed protein product [Ilex paraguariensis]|uniref:Uncharacterized protein n=1 Tax=Ilex paraguariensis TaxID=185542 RepID=A0ABC8ULA5_9AQUA